MNQLNVPIHLPLGFVIDRLNTSASVLWIRYMFKVYVTPNSAFRQVGPDIR